MRLSQSSVKDLEKESTCPTRWKAQWIDKLITSQSTEAQQKGKYFEQLVLGKGAIENEAVDDLPRLKNGNKSVDQIRIEEQAELAKDMLFNTESEHYLGFKVKDVQVRLKHENYPIVLDVLAVDKDGVDIDIDLKLTKDVTQTFGDYGWGNHESLDYLQQVHYHNIYKKIYNKESRSMLLVFDYSKNRRVKSIELDITDKAIDESEYRFEAAKEVVTYYNENGWKYNASESECSDCPLNCEFKFGNKPIIEEFKILI